MQTKGKKAVKKTNDQYSFIETIEQIVEKSKDCKLSPLFFSECVELLLKLALPFRLTLEQALFFANIVEGGVHDSVDVADLAKWFGCSKLTVYKYDSDIENLIDLGLVESELGRYDNKEEYSIPIEVFNALKRNEVYVDKVPSGLSGFEFFGELNRLFDKKDDHVLTYSRLKNRIDLLCKNNKHINVVKYLDKSTFLDDEKVLYLLMCKCFVEDNDDNITYTDFNDLFDDNRHARYHEECLSRGNHPLMKKGLIEYASEDGMSNHASYKLTDKSKNEVLQDVLLKPQALPKDLISPSSIVEKKLFYNATELRQIDELGQLLMPGNFEQVKQRLHECGLRSGFACLFYGAPGTGKTETVMQLARTTGREIMQVDFAKAKSCWVGESEKNVKHIFDKYRAAVKSSQYAPILLFNEADALIGTRMEKATRAVDKMENAIQNIILQEMETLDGIMVATTNLSQNLDKAFERRFIYKVEFSKPSVEARILIWQSMIKGLRKADARVLAERYEYSGGQIENIARRRMVQYILSGKPCTLKTLCNYCDEEALVNNHAAQIGFHPAV